MRPTKKFKVKASKKLKPTKSIKASRKSNVSKSVKSVKSVKANKHLTSKRKIMASKSFEAPYIRIFLTNLGKYNEGELVGKWIDLPVDDDFESAFEAIGINDRYEEWFITDYETNTGLHIGEYDDIYDLNEKAEEIDGLDEYDFVGVRAYLEAGYSFDYALENYSEIINYGSIFSDSDLALEYINETVGDVSELGRDTLEMYFDYDSYGSDMRINGTFVEIDGDTIELTNP